MVGHARGARRTVRPVAAGLRRDVRWGAHRVRATAEGTFSAFGVYCSGIAHTGLSVARQAVSGETSGFARKSAAICSAHAE